MKLNLLPTSVSKGKQTQTAILLSVLIALLCSAAAIGMILTSRAEVADARTQALAALPKAQLAAATAKHADTVISEARVILTNIGLADAMRQHNTVYADLYDEVRRYVPAFYRVTSMTAVPSGDESATVTLNGVLQSYQQYADLMLAMYRVPGATTVARAGYQNTDRFVPGLTLVDQFGRPIKPGEQPIPDDPLARLDYYVARGGVTGFSGTGGFGTAPGTRGAMPEWSNVAIAVVISRNIQTPNPGGTLAAIGSAPAPPAGGAQAGFNPPTPGGAPPAGPATRGSRSGAAAQEDL